MSHSYTEIRNEQFMGQACVSIQCQVKQAVAGGTLAGLSFITFQIAAGVAMGSGTLAFLRYAGGIILGPEGTEAWFPLSAAVPIGMAVHLVLSVLFAGGFLWALHFIPWRADTPGSLIAWACITGLVLWLGNFYVIAPLFGWSWFPNGTHPLVQGFAAHVFFYGLPLGLYFAHGKRRSGSPAVLENGRA